MAAKIKNEILNGDFDYAQYFPRSANAIPAATEANLVFNVMDQWIKLAVLKDSTKRTYRRSLEGFWKINLTNVPVGQIKYSDILKVLNQGTWKSSKCWNNELSMIRQAFEFAKFDKMIAENPCDEIKRASYQAPRQIRLHSMKQRAS